MQRFEIFKPGAHTSAGGAALTFSEADLEATVRAYDPAKHEAPIVVGHPKDNHPAYGWVSKLDFAEGVMVVEPKEVDPDFAEMVQAGRFKKRSASFYAPDAKANPVPGVYYLRHVGFLGAQPPAVKGLKDVAFAEDDGVVEFADAWMIDGLVARLFRGMRDFMLSQYGQEKTDQALPNFAIQDLEQMAREAQPKPESAIPFSEDDSMTPEQIKELQDKAARVDALEAENTALKGDQTKLKADFAELQGKQVEAEKVAALAAIRADIEPLVKAGKVLPAEVETLTSFAASLDDKVESFNFGEGDQAKKVTARTLYLEQLKARPKVVDFSERAPGGESDQTTSDVKDLSTKAKAYVAKRAQGGDSVSYTEAVDAVLAGKDQ
jgi:cell division protein FtsB